MASQDSKLHFVLFPMMAQGHMIPMMDTARLLAHHENVMVTIVTTPKNASRFTSFVARYVESGLHIKLIQLKFPCKEFGLPEGCENLVMLPTLGIASKFFNASKFLQQEVEKIFEELKSPATCIISDRARFSIRSNKKPFIWVIREGNELEELKKWIEESGFEGRINGRGLVIKDWAPQLLILSHHAIGGFLTHCGWNSIIEAICAGVPMVTWPLFGDQFFNECLVVEILKVGVKIGVKSPMKWGEEEENGVLVKKEDIERGIEVLMDETCECKERRKRIKELAEMARKRWIFTL